MKQVLKKLYFSLKKVMPPAIQQRLRRRYYLGVVRRYDAASWEWYTSACPFIPSGGCVLDIGANVGYLSRLFAERVGKGGRVVSVEPIPETYDVLRHSMHTLHPDVVLTLPNCMSDQPGEVKMAVPSYQDGGENYYESHIVRDGQSADKRSSRVYQVSATTIDMETMRLGMTPDFIKIDVEGHELGVIRGGEKTIRASLPPLLIEIMGNPDEPNSPSASLFNLLGSWGYTPFMLDNRSLRVRKSGDKAVDYLFLTDKDRATIT